MLLKTKIITITNVTTSDPNYAKKWINQGY